MTDFRAALWAAVSSAPQAAPDKGSLTDQIEKGRAHAAAHGWKVVSELVVGGQSREYTSLDGAIRDIPELAELIDLARAGKINLLVVYDTSRFRGLQSAVIKTLAAYGVQVYSVSQPFEPVAPEGYRYYTNDTQTIMTHIGALLSDVDIATFRRRYAQGMPRRVDVLGLPYNRLPFGYRRPAGRELDPRAVPEQVPAECAVLLEMKRRYEAGDSAEALVEWLTTAGIRAPRVAWGRTAVLFMLTNPWYAGYTVRGKKRVHRDPLTGRRVVTPQPRAEWILKPGRHAPLWTVAEYECLLALRNRRGAFEVGKTKNTHFFSRLMICAECQRPMHASWRLADGTLVYRCIHGPSAQGHGRIYEREIIEKLRLGLAEFVSGPIDDIPVPAATTEAARVATAIAENDAARARAQRLYLRGGIGDDDMDARLAELAAERKVLDDALAAASDDAGRAERQRQQRSDAAELLDNFDAVWEQSGLIVNARVGRLIERMTVRGRVIESVVVRE